MNITYYILSIFFIIASLIPLIPHPHWVFRVFDFAKVQILIIQIILFTIGFLFVDKTPLFYILQILLIGCMIYEVLIVYKYTPLYKIERRGKTKNSSNSISLISANVYQFNKDYQKFIHLINQNKPDIFLTMESNKDWENALSIFDKEYPYHYKVGLENTYGIHFYSKIKTTQTLEHYFIADDIPSLECKLETNDGFKFTFFGVHPPPPSPTEEETSKERDGELLSVAKKVNEEKNINIVVGDFNNVAWAKSSILFRKTSGLIDPRIGRGLISTFHAKYRLLRFPIDQLFHSPLIFVEEIKTLENFGSDHLPLYCKFFIDKENNSQEEQVEDVNKEDLKEAQEIIEEGKAEDGNRDTVVTED